MVGVALVNTSCGDLAEMTLGLPLVLAKVVRPLAPGTLRGLGRRADLVEKARGLGADLAFVVTRKMAFADKYVSPSVVDFLEQMIRATPIDVIAEFYPALMGHDKVGCLDVLGKVPAVVVVRAGPADPGRARAAHRGGDAGRGTGRGGGGRARAAAGVPGGGDRRAAAADRPGPARVRGGAHRVNAITVNVPTAADMHELGLRLAGVLRAGDLLVMTGHLGAGKTTLTQGIGEA